MKKVILAVCVLAVVGSIAFVSVRGRLLAPRNITSSSSFAFDLLRKFAAQHPNDNTAVSPVSVSFALGMLANGARGDTQAGILTTLGARGKSVAELNRSSAALLSDFGSQSDVSLSIANSLWVKQGLGLRSEFADVCRRNYRAGIEELDFGDPASAKRIDSWIEKKTNGLINQSVGPIDPATALILVNTVYFKGVWTYGFDRRRTYNGDFHPGLGKTIKVPLMGDWRKDRYYFAGKDFQAVKLPYGHGRFAMLVFLPSEKLGVHGFLSRLNESSIARWNNLFKKRSVDLRMPRFKMACTSEQEMKNTLSDMGMADSFSPGAADFSGISTGKGWIDKIVHKVFVDVNEKGTEAAASTVMHYVKSDGSPHPEAVVRVDRPFFFVIWDDQTKSCLFEAVVSDPTK